MNVSRTTVVFSALALAGCAATAAPGGEEQARTRNVPLARAVGPAQSCVRMAEITNSEVRNDWTIDFERGSGRRIYRAQFDNRCPGLNAARAFTYSTSLTELCTTDIIYPLHQAGGLNRGAGCGISRFIPMEVVR